MCVRGTDGEREVPTDEGYPDREQQDFLWAEVWKESSTEK